MYIWSLCTRLVQCAFEFQNSSLCLSFAIFLFNENYFTLEVLVPEFLMPYNPSCGGRGACLNNLQGQTGITACAAADFRYLSCFATGTENCLIVKLVSGFHTFRQHWFQLCR